MGHLKGCLNYFIKEFFEKVVDRHSNKLVLAVHAYQTSEWFILCCTIAKKFYEEVTLPIKQMLRIDEYKKMSGPERSWQSLKNGFRDICTKLANYGKMNPSTGRQKLEMNVAAQVKEAIERQLDAMKFYRDEDVSPEVSGAMKQTPRTNLGCESEFSHGDMDLKRAGGSTSLKTVSDKHVIKRNALYQKQKWQELSIKEKRKNWKWAATSPQAIKVSWKTYFLYFIVLN